MEYGSVEALVAMINAVEGSTEYKTQLNSQNKQAHVEAQQETDTAERFPRYRSELRRSQGELLIVELHGLLNT